MILILKSMVQTWCSSISSQFHISWEQLEILVLLSLSLAFGYLLLRICDVVLFGQTTTSKLRQSSFILEEGDPYTYDYVHIRPNRANETASSEEEENLLCKADTDFHFNMPQHVREEEEDNLETIIGSTSYPSKVVARIEEDVTSYPSSLLQEGNDAIGLRKRNPSQLESTIVHRDISAVEGEEGYVMVTKKKTSAVNHPRYTS
jgi:hypothetical protein